MDKFFTALFFQPVAWLSRCGVHPKYVVCIFILPALAGVSTRGQAQEPTFYESFDDVPAGEIPPGWKIYSVGGDAPGSYWFGTTYGSYGNQIMQSATYGPEYALPGQVDEDWLVTPQITPAAGDFLIFDGGQRFTWFEYGSTFHIRISTATSNRADFTATLASYTETEFPGYLYDERLILDLSAYAGMPIYIAFVHENYVEETPDGPDTELFYLDNVAVRPVQPLDYIAGEIDWATNDVMRLADSPTQFIIGTLVRTSGDTGDASLTSMTFSTEGTSGSVTIKEAILYTTYGDRFIATGDGQVWADVFGTVTDPGDTFTIEGNQLLGRGETYFWLIYQTIEVDGEIAYPYPVVDATFEKVVVNGVEHDATLKTAEGTRPIVEHIPTNDNFADARELLPSAAPVRYGSSNHMATYEPDFEETAYCAPYAAADGLNSVWWHFKAPHNGMITADLSACNWNTQLTIQDENMVTLACNRNIDEEAGIFQSKITDFEVSAGQDLYIRVTGEGAPESPNADNGVVLLDFSFITPVGVDDPLSPQEISALYPNPANGNVYVDLVLHRPGDVVLDVRDVMGRPVLTQHKGMWPAGRYEQVPLDIASLPAGPYVVHVRGGSRAGAHRLIVTR